MLGRGAGRHYERDPVTCHVSRVPAVQYEYSVSRLVAGRVTVPPPHQLCSLLSPEPAPPITHQPAQAAAVTTAVGTSSGLHRWQHSAVWKLPRNVLDKNIALHCISTVTVCSVPGTRTGYQVDICSSQSWHLTRPGVSQAIPAPGPRPRLLSYSRVTTWRGLAPEAGAGAGTGRSEC